MGNVPSLPGASVCGRPSCLHPLLPPALLLPSLDHVSLALQGQRDRRGPSPGSAEAPERAGLARAQLCLPGEVPVCARLPRQGLTHPVWKSSYRPHFPDRKVRHGVVSEQSDSSSCLTKCSHLQPTLFFFFATLSYSLLGIQAVASDLLSGGPRDGELGLLASYSGSVENLRSFFSQMDCFPDGRYALIF